MGQHLPVLLCAVRGLEIGAVQCHCPSEEGREDWESTILFRSAHSWWTAAGVAAGRGSLLLQVISGGIWERHHFQQGFPTIVVAVRFVWTADGVHCAHP